MHHVTKCQYICACQVKFYYTKLILKEVNPVFCRNWGRTKEQGLIVLETSTNVWQRWQDKRINESLIIIIIHSHIGLTKGLELIIIVILFFIIWFYTLFKHRLVMLIIPRRKITLLKMLTFTIIIQCIENLVAIFFKGGEQNFLRSMNYFFFIYCNL